MRGERKISEDEKRARDFVVGASVLKDLKYIDRHTKLPKTKLGMVIHVNPKAISRWESYEVKNIKPEHAYTVKRLKEIVQLGLKVFNALGFWEFFENPQPVFGNKSALDMLMIGEFDRVESVLASMYEGASL